MGQTLLRRRAPLVLALLLAAAVPAAGRELVVQSFDVTVVVRDDGTLEVTEVLQPRFRGHWNGMYRTIPVEYRTPQGFNFSLLLRDTSITDEKGKALRFEDDSVRHYRRLKIWIPDAEDATRTLNIRYRVLNGLKFFEDHDELYWNVTGDEWEVPIESASARIVLPTGVTGVRTLTFTGAYGSRENDADSQTAGNTVEVRMRRPLAFREGLTVVAGWDKGFVREPTALAQTQLFMRANWPLGVPVLVLGLMFWVWSTRGRDPRLRPIAAQYAPPGGLTPAEAGTLADNSADMRDVTATIVDLAVRGFLRIEEKERERLFGLWTDNEYVFHLRKPRSEWPGLKPHEVRLLGALFKDGDRDTVKLSDLQNKFYKRLPEIRDGIFDALVTRRYYLQRPDTVRFAYLMAGVVLGVVLGLGGAFVSAALGMQPLPFIIGGVASGLIVCVFAFVMPARTLAGARALEHVRGFEDFLEHVESDRFQRMIKTPEMFEKFLPFAMALGVDRRWAAAFQDMYTQPPSWYIGPGYGPRFHTGSFVNNLGTMSTRAAAVMVSAPRSSGGSGFGGRGGGGFSGGGFGGGGGGGF